jgi:hypothetical protein
MNIDLRLLKTAVNDVLDHVIEDLGTEQVRIEEADDFYWECAAAQRYDRSKKPSELNVGRLSDDVDFVALVRRGQSADVAYNLVHVAPLLQYVAEKVRK